MSAKTGYAHSKYAGLLPIEPSEDFSSPLDLRAEPMDLREERVDLTPEDVPFPDPEPSAHKRPRDRFLIAFCAGVATTLLWQSYGDAARERIANLYPQLGWLAPRPAPTAQNPHVDDVIALSSGSAAPPAEQPNAISFDFDVVGQNVEKIATSIAAGRKPTPDSTDQIVTGQEQMIRSTNQTATTVDEAPAKKASNATVESQDDAASLQPSARVNARPTEARPPQRLAENGKPLSATSSHDGSCFASASAVIQDHPKAWPSWTLRAPGHEGSLCWYAAARPRGSDHRPRVSHYRSETVRGEEEETVGTTNTELFAPFAPHGTRIT